MSTLRDYRALTALVAVFLILGGIYAVVTPLFEAGDEIWHYPFVQSLASGHGLPVQDPGRKDLWEQEGGQPPLYYALSAAVTFWIDTRDLPDRLWRNPYAKIGIPLAFGNKNLIVHSSAEDFPWQDTTLAVHLIRFLSLFLSAGTVVLTYLLAKEIYPSLPPLVKGGSQGLPPLKGVESDALVARSTKRRSGGMPSSSNKVVSEGPASYTSKTVVEELVSPLGKGGWRGVAFWSAALVAFNPMFLFISASVNNDSLAVLLASLALLLIVQLATRGLNKRRSFVLGIVCGLGALTKVSDLGLLPLALLVVAWVAWRQGPNDAKSSRFANVTTRFLVPAMWITIPSLLIAAWWYARNYVLYGDPLAFNVWLKIAGGRSTPATLLDLVNEFQGFRISFWGNFGGVNLIAPGWVYTLLDVICVVAVVGLGAAILKRRLSATLLIPALWLGIVFAGLLRWTLLTYASQGRLIFPAISAVGVLLAFGLGNLGLEGWRAPSWKRWRGSSFQPLNLLTCSFLFAFALAAPFLIITPAYSLPMRLPGDTPVPNPVHITYAADDAQPELAGFEIGRTARGGEELPLTLYLAHGDRCWRGPLCLRSSL